MPMLHREDIPSEIIEELNEYYDTIDWKYYDMSIDDLRKDLYEQMVSRRLKHQVEHDDFGEKKIIDPNTFETKSVYGNSVGGFIVRAMLDDKNSIVYPWQVLPTGLIVDPRNTKEIKQGDIRDDK